MMNQIANTFVAAECTRLRRDLSLRGYKRFMSRLLSGKDEIEIVFSLEVGESPKKSVYERMAACAEQKLMAQLTETPKFSLIEKKRSPKAGTVTYRVQYAFPTDAPLRDLNVALSDLRELADTCTAIDDHAMELRSNIIAG